MISELLAIVPPPPHPVWVADEADWQGVEAGLRVRFPRDYKDINRSYGSGWFAEWIWVLIPAPAPQAYTLQNYSTSADIVLELLRASAHGGAKHTEKSLVPIAWTRAGAEFFYLIHDERDWDVLLVDLRGALLEHYSMQLTSLLARLLSRSIRSDVLSDNFPVSDLVFTRA